MGRLRAAMQGRYKERNEDVKLYTPRNLEELQISFRGERVAKVCTRFGSSKIQASFKKVAELTLTLNTNRLSVN